MKKGFFLLMAFIFVSFLLTGKETDTRLLRFPDINQDLIVFVYAGDIWSVPSSGGEAKRLTSHYGLELFPKISPDGRWLAFSAEYSGSRQVYIMPAKGGTPRQLTYYNDVGIMPPRGGYDYVVLDWTPDSQKILVLANRTPFGERMGRYYLVNTQGGLEEPLPIPEAGFGSFSNDGKKICYTPISREFRTWKRYKGGRAADVWIYDLEKNHSKRITTFPGTDQIPIWFKDRIYFASDRNLTLNIYAYDINSEKVIQVTHHDEYDVMWPSGENGQIVYENGGYIYKLDLNTGQSQKLDIYIHYDNPNVLPYITNVQDFIDEYDISPTGQRAVFCARGDIYSIPAKEGMTVNLTRSQGVREISPVWSPDGKHIAYYSDLSGEYEIYLHELGNNRIEQLTFNSQSWKNPPVWSPDSTKLIFSNQQYQLQILNIKTKNLVQVEPATNQNIQYYRWSSDSQAVIYSKQAKNRQLSLWLYRLPDGTSWQLTDGTFNDYNPVFSQCGQYIFFLSDRDFNLTFSSFEFDYLYQNSTRIYALALNPSVPALFPDNDDQEPKTTQKEDKVNPDQKKKPGIEKEKKSSPLDMNGINLRIVAFPLPAGNYNSLFAIDGGIVYQRNNILYQFLIKDKKEEEIVKKCDNVIISADMKKLLYRANKNFHIIDIKPKQEPETGKLNLQDMTMKIDPRKEWQQIFIDGWRIFRDWFYVVNLHGLDWLKMREKYQKLIPFVSHRADLDYIFGELVGETNTGHCYVNWGDFKKVTRIDTGLLGAELKADFKAGRYMINKIFQGENWIDNRRCPLTEQGVDIKEGDFLIELNGYDVKVTDNPYIFLENTVNKRISIKVNRIPQAQGARTFLIKPIASELELRYLDWVQSRRQLVDRLSGGQIGYIHVPNTSTDGNRELFRGMYAYHDKKALIIDDRYNGGGFIPDVMTDLLDRKTLNFWAVRGLDPNKTPAVAHDGPKVMLINHFSSSGGDAFPYYFKKKNLGLLIGTRTWGGLVGISGNASLVDGGFINVPTFGFFDTEGNWAVEGVGVYPDIEVYDEPHLVASGHDPSLEKAIEVLLQQLKKESIKEVKKPVDPNRSKWIEKDIK